MTTATVRSRICTAGTNHSPCTGRLNFGSLFVDCQCPCHSVKR